ncbi:MAG TPA: hypothetical protein VMH02_00055, partial [Verrucomicrobiae bacterium]|nr:hypothetical protein [Verrucomicrobiae bacterium]
GVVSCLVPNGRNGIAVRAHFADEVRLQDAPGYADVPAARWQSNGMGRSVREYYAGGFFFTGLDAERLGDRAAALRWYARAAAYFPDPAIAARIAALGGGAGLPAP